MQDNFTPSEPSSTAGGPGPSSPPPAPAVPQPMWVYPKKKASPVKRILIAMGGMIFFMSLLLNFYLAAMLAARMDKRLATTTITEGSKNEVIAVYKIEGIIDDGAAEQFAKFYRQIIDDDAVRAVVIRVDSPGGGVNSSDRIHALIKRLKIQGDKRVVVSMGGVAASGGYYVSAPADEIVAEPTTITGSIGVIMGWLVVEGTLDKIGIEAVILKSSNAEGWKDEISSFQKPDSRQRAHLQQILDTIQERFEQVVKEGRGEKLKTKQVTYTRRIGEGDGAKEKSFTETEPLNGKIYMPAEAMELGLIDAIGYQDSAIEKAQNLAGLKNPKVVRYSPKQGLLSQLMQSRSASGLQLNAKTIEELQTPRIMLMWKAE